MLIKSRLKVVYIKIFNKQTTNKQQTNNKQTTTTKDINIEVI